MKYFLVLAILIFNINAADFNKDIKEILSRKCFNCHGPQKQKGKLRLDKKEFALKALNGKDGAIPLLNRINHDDPDEIMPPPDKGLLTIEEKKLLKEWINEGAIYQKHWAFTKPAKASPPSLNDQWISNDIDKFILQKLNENNLKPNMAVFDYRLLRRISFILTGLPPTNQYSELFNQNKIDYQTYLGILINSPAYGEHMAQFWLDGARYADTNGIEYDNSRPIWPYRDWVIKAFNENMPYDQFLTEQVAGDLLKNSTMSQNTATGFLRCNPTTNEMGSLEEEMQVQYSKDRLNTTMSVFNGLTVGCAECHDHKYDPFSQKQYYEMLAFFNNIDGRAVGHIFDRADEPVIAANIQSFKEIKTIKMKLKALEAQMAELKLKSKDKFWWWQQKQFSESKTDFNLISSFDAFYPFNGSDRLTALNIATSTKDAIKGVVFRQEGKYDKGVEFRQSCYIDCLGIPPYSENDSFTVGGWFKFTGESSGLVMGKFYADKGWALLTKDKKIILKLAHSKNNALEVITDSLSLNWQHVAFVYDGSKNATNIKCYINGQQVKLKIRQNNLTESAFYNVILRIGSLLDKCSLDDIFCTKKALTQNEINKVLEFNSVKRFSYIDSAKLTPQQKKTLHLYYLQNDHKEYKPLHIESVRLKKLLKGKLDRTTLTMVMKEKKVHSQTFLLNRGNYQTPGEAVTRKLPDSIYNHSKSLPKNRLGLAQWMLDRKNPLTARVIVNKIWQNIFGRGLVETSADFGLQGTYPSHPELLDFLSVYLMENNWDLKKLIKFILSSSTFQQSSLTNSLKRQKDPEASMYSYFQRRRKTGEAIRDQALAVSGLLVNKIGGKPVFPYQPLNLWKETTASTSDTEYYIQSSGDDNYRRSIYTFWKRNFPPPLLTIFDAPTRHFTKSKRNISNSPLQALALLNDIQLTETHEALVAQIPKGIADKKILFLFNKILNRPPTSNELTLIKDSIIKKKISWTTLCGALMNLDEFITIE